jgi:hypothetical protein
MQDTSRCIAPARVKQVFALASAVLMLVSCGSEVITGADGLGSAVPTPARISFSAKTTIVPALNDTTRVRATVTSATGAVLSTQVTYRALGIGTITVDATGLVSGIALGQAYVVASAASMADTALVTVTQIPAHVTFAYPVDSIYVLDSIQPAYSVFDRRNNLIPNAVVPLSVTNAGMARISGNVRVVGVGIGPTTILAGPADAPIGRFTLVLVSRAHAHIRPDQLCLRVGYPYQYVMHTYDDFGMETVPGATTWKVSDTSLATIDAGGMLHSLAGGHLIVTGSARGMSDSADAVLDPAALGTTMTCK